MIEVDRTTGMGVMMPKFDVVIKVDGLLDGDLLSYLQEAACDYDPPLDKVVNLLEYSHKLISRGTVLCAVVDRQIIGILAGYFNDPTSGFAFISQFHVRMQFRRWQIGRMLMDKSVERARDIGFKALRLKVNKSNNIGIGFYEHYGFIKLGEDQRQFEMIYELNGGSNDGM